MASIDVQNLKKAVERAKKRDGNGQSKHENPFILRTHQVCDFFNISQVAFLKWKKNTTFPKAAIVSEGYIDLKLVYAWRETYFYGSHEAASSMANEKLNYQKARARREQLEVQELERQLVSIEKVTADLSFLANAIKNYLLSWSKTLPEELAHKDERAIMSILNRETRDILTKLSQGMKAIFPKGKKE